MFYDNFDKLCTKIGTSPTAFTRDVLGLSTSKVTAWKNGSIPKYEILQQIADVFGVSVGELFDGEPYDNRPEFPPKPKRIKGAKAVIIKKASDNDARDIIVKKVKTLDDEKIDRLLGYLEALEEE